MGLEPSNLRITDSEGTCKGHGWFIKPLTALRMALAADAWAFLNGGSIDDDRMLDACRIYDAHCIRWVSGVGMQPDEAGFIARWNETVEVLRPHVDFIKRVGRELAQKGVLTAGNIYYLLSDESVPVEAICSESIKKNGCAPYSMKVG